MDRRRFLTGVSAGSLLLLAHGSLILSRQSGSVLFRRFPAGVVSTPNCHWDRTKRIPLAWPVFPIVGKGTAYNESTVLKFPNLSLVNAYVRLRITSEIDIREEITIGIVLPGREIEIACLDIKYAHPFQPFEVLLDKHYLDDICKHGLSLYMNKGSNNTWFYGSWSENASATGLQPQLLFGNYPGNINAHRALVKQLALFLDNSKGVDFEAPHTQPVNGRFHSIEDLLPLAAIVSLYPEHASVQLAVDYCLSLSDDLGLIANSSHVTSEGCYTIAYPLAKILIFRNDHDLARLAVKQLDHRIDLLSNEGVISQSSCEYQSGSGSWNSYVDRPESLPDSTTTSGIALALAWGIHAKLLPGEPFVTRTLKSRLWLRDRLTEDGYLQNISQINRGGGPLQANGTA